MERKEVVKIMKECRAIKQSWRTIPLVPEVFKYRNTRIEIVYDKEFNVIEITSGNELSITAPEVLSNLELWQEQVAEFLTNKEM